MGSGKWNKACKKSVSGTIYVEQGAKGTVQFKITAQNGKAKKTYKVTIKREAPAPKTYKLTVVNGSGSGIYKAGTKVAIKAAAAPTGKAFDKWNNGTTSANFTYTTTAKAVTLTALYKAVPPVTPPANPEEEKPPIGIGGIYTLGDWLSFNKPASTFTVTGTARWDWAQEMADKVNTLRAENGLDPLIYNQQLGTAAMLRSAQCYVYYEHYQPDGVSFSKMFSPDDEDPNPLWNSWQLENIAGYRSLAEAYDGWLASPGHKSTMLQPAGSRPNNKGFFGVGCVEVSGGAYWVLEVVFSSNDVSSVGGSVMPTANIDSSWAFPFSKTYYDAHPNADWVTGAKTLINAAYAD
jgi:uncharacterized protein YkwD